MCLKSVRFLVSSLPNPAVKAFYVLIFFVQRLYVLIFEQKRLDVPIFHVLIKNECTHVNSSTEIGKPANLVYDKFSSFTIDRAVHIQNIHNKFFL